jgi:hypothetical protein
MTTKMAMAEAIAENANTNPTKSQLCEQARHELRTGGTESQTIQFESKRSTFRNSLPDWDNLESSRKSADSTVLIMNSETMAIKPGSTMTPIFPDGGSQPPSTPTDPDGIDEALPTVVAVPVEEL